MKSVTPYFFYISGITNLPSFNGKIFRKKSMLENFCVNDLNINPVDKTKLSCNTPHQHNTTVFLETYPLLQYHVANCSLRIIWMLSRIVPGRV